jgi:hypothetical protein
MEILSPLNTVRIVLYVGHWVFDLPDYIEDNFTFERGRRPLILHMGAYNLPEES